MKMNEQKGTKMRKMDKNEGKWTQKRENEQDGK